MRHQGIILVAIILTVVFLMAMNASTVTPNIPPIPKGAKYFTYFDDLTLKIGENQVLAETFTNTTSLNLNNRALISKGIYHSPGGSLELRQELDTYDEAGKAISNKVIDFTPNSEVNMTVWFMVPKANTHAYEGGHMIDLSLVLCGEPGYNATVIVHLDWGSINGPSSGLALQPWVNFHDPLGTQSVYMNRTETNGGFALYSFDDWHRLSVIVGVDGATVYVDGVLSAFITSPFKSIRRIYSLELAIQPARANVWAAT
jgi:hypothetical protein